ncbi:MAG: efflux RND transporter periplasmic adaptor subunit [Acidobacteria bacterium]|jgi:HlyD family secretion protein|nr:efflux RND transporter periplasmic adaptor subunit [Acidobacteriota bacterium]
MSAPATRVRKSPKGAAAAAVAVLALAAFLVRGATKRTPVDSYVLEPVDLDYTVLANCTVDYPKPLDLTFLREGIVSDVAVEEGDAVTKGLVLARIDDFDAERNLAISADSLRSAELKLRNAREEVLPNLGEKLNEYEVNLKQAALNRDRYTELLAAGGVSKADLERAEKEYQRALSQYNQQKLELESYSRSGRLADLEYQVSIGRAQLDLARRVLENTRIAAPFDGTVLKVDIQPGQKATMATRAFTVVEKAPWELGLYVDQREMPFLREGLVSLVTMDAYPGDRIRGEVSYVCSEIDKEKNTCELRIRLVEPPAFIKPGMAGRAEILAARFEKALALPARFAKKGPGGGAVWRWNGKRAELVPAALKPVGERWVLVEGLEAGTVVLDAAAAASARRLKPGRRVAGAAATGE